MRRHPRDRAHELGRGATRTRVYVPAEVLEAADAICERCQEAALADDSGSDDQVVVGGGANSDAEGAPADTTVSQTTDEKRRVVHLSARDGTEAKCGAEGATGLAAWLRGATFEEIYVAAEIIGHAARVCDSCCRRALEDSSGSDDIPESPDEGVRAVYDGAYGWVYAAPHADKGSFMSLISKLLRALTR